jgi:hypothetical protein
VKRTRHRKGCAGNGQGGCASMQRWLGARRRTVPRTACSMQSWQEEHMDRMFYNAASMSICQQISLEAPNYAEAS